MSFLFNIISFSSILIFFRAAWHASIDYRWEWCLSVHLSVCQWWANLKSQSYIKISNVLFSNPKSDSPNPNPKSKPQIPISKLKNPNQIPYPNFYISTVHKHELRSVQQRRELAVCQCHCQCYLIASLKCLFNWQSCSSLPEPVKTI